MPGFLTHFTVKIGGVPASRDFMADLTEIVVDSSLYLPAMFTITLQDYDLKWVDNLLLTVGTAVEIAVDDRPPKVLIKGEIAALEPNFAADGRTTLLIRGYDKSHRLHRGRKTRSFLKMTDSDVVRKIAGEVGLVPDIDSTTVRYDYILQNNQTNMEFLQDRAERNGYQVYAADGKLCFKRQGASAGAGPTLKFGENLLSFRPRWAATHQADKVTVRGWDQKAKKAIVSQVMPSSSFNQGGMITSGGLTAQAAFGAAEAIVTDRPVATVDEAKALATGLGNDISREFVDAEGTCTEPGVMAGYSVTIAGVGTRFSGKYFVTSATHVYNETGYEATFTMTGREPHTLGHLVGPTGGPGQGLMRGVVTALVTNLKDPENLGRVKVKYPWLADNVESDWVRLASPMAGALRGFLCLPEVNDEVLVAFEHGDVHRPYIVGSLWSSTDKPPKGNNEAVDGNGKVVQRILKTRAGHTITLDDKEGAEKIVIQDKTAKNTITIDSKTNTITIAVDKDLSSSAKGATTIESTGKITLKSQDDLTVECKNFTVKAQMNADVQANAKVTVKNAAAQIALSGPTVNINNGALEVT